MDDGGTYSTDQCIFKVASIAELGSFSERSRATLEPGQRDRSLDGSKGRSMGRQRSDIPVEGFENGFGGVCLS